MKVKYEKFDVDDGRYKDVEEEFEAAVINLLEDIRSKLEMLNG